MDFLLPATAQDLGAEPPPPASPEQPPPAARPAEEVMALVAADTRVVFDDFYRDFYRVARPRIGRAVALALGDLDLGVQATDEALTRAYERWDSVSSLDRPEAWVYRVATNWALSVLRHRRRSQHRLYDPDHNDASAIADPELHAALAELDAKHRSVIVCRHLLGWSVAETAAALRLREGTVKSRLHRHAPPAAPPQPPPYRPRCDTGPSDTGPSDRGAVMRTTKHDDDRLQHYLSARAESITLPVADSSGIVARATRRRHRRRTMTGVATVAVLATGAARLATQRPEGNPVEAVGAAAPGVVDSALEWTVVEPDVGLGCSRSTVQAGDGALYSLSTAPGPADFNDRSSDMRSRLYRSDDGAEWAEVDLPEDLWASSLAADGDRLYALGTAPAGGGRRSCCAAQKTVAGPGPTRSWCLPSSTICRPDSVAS